MNLTHTLQPGVSLPGSTNPYVELLQRALVRAGFNPGPVDGGFQAGSTTEQAVRNFQAANGLVVNGIVGPETWEALPDEDMQGLPTLEQGSEGGAVALVQRALKQSGFDAGPVNGVFGPTTDAQVRSYQAAMLIVMDG